jgi:hypothetical protein
MKGYLRRYQGLRSLLVVLLTDYCLIYYRYIAAAGSSLTHFATHKRHYTALSESVHGPQ